MQVNFTIPLHSAFQLLALFQAIGILSAFSWNITTYFISLFIRKYVLLILLLGVSAQMFSQKVIELQKGKELKLTFQKIEKPVQVFPKIVQRKVKSQKSEIVLRT